MNKGAARLKEVKASKIRAVSDKANALEALGRPVIRFSTGEPDFATVSPIKQATMQAIEDNYSHYASNRGDLKLREEIAKQVECHHGIVYDPMEEILITSGGSEAINHVMLGLINPKDEVIVCTPAFLSYENMIHMAEGVFVDVPLKKENGFQLNIEDIKEAITPRTKMIVMNNPCNPTGAVYDPASIQALCELCIQHDLLVFSDEIYDQLVYDDKTCTSIAAYPSMKERTIMMNGFSKAYAMTGWRLAYLCAPKELIEPLLKVHQYATTCAPTFIQVGVAKVMNEEKTRQEVKEMVKRFDQRRQMVIKVLKEIPKLDFVIPQGAFYVFIDVSKTGLDGQQFADALLEEKGVAVVPGNALGSQCDDFIRLSYATSDENVMMGMQLIKEFIKEL
ncbi:pyridoxal phosphate-dependent aminotransferase [Beduini massiliensis]|uniref:pyridoxal phosphate-dependent aminotransferase n=1 Tax=Beduini massiliensis TaxID=1585974 RepID=UPI00059AAD68|nr:pyridoxal phosphate-dependent aminotransferase [Beduini massiliensis]